MYVEFLYDYKVRYKRIDCFAGFSQHTKYRVAAGTKLAVDAVRPSQRRLPCGRKTHASPQFSDISIAPGDMSNPKLLEVPNDIFRVYHEDLPNPPRPEDILLPIEDPHRVIYLLKCPKCGEMRLEVRADYTCECTNMIISVVPRGYSLADAERFARDPFWAPITERTQRPCGFLGRVVGNNEHTLQIAGR